MWSRPSPIVSLARGIAALAGLSGLAAGVPAALIHYIGWPLPQHVPPPRELYAFLTSPLSDDAIISALACVVWAAWACLIVALAAELTAHLTGRHLPQLPGVGWAQVVAGGLISAVVATGPAAAATAPPHSAVAAAPALPLTADQPGSAAETSGHEYVVRPHDTLWGIAERLLGDGDRWPEIARANYGRPQPDGGTLTHVHWLNPGWRLHIPASGAQRHGRWHTVRPGETLATIAAHELGSPRRWEQLFRLNRGTTQPDGGSLGDPDIIQVGWHLRLPSDAHHRDRPDGQSHGGTRQRHPPQPEPTPSPRSSATPRRSTTGRTDASRAPAHDVHERPSASVTLPSGAIAALGLAAAISAAIVLARKRRRAGRRPARTPGTRAPDSSPPPVARRMRRADLARSRTPSEPPGEATDPDLFAAPVTTPPPAPRTETPTSPQRHGADQQAARGIAADKALPSVSSIPFAIDETRRREIHIDLTGNPGIGVAGPHAEDAVRHAAITAIAAPATGPDGDPGEVILAGAEAMTLLPGDLDVQAVIRYARPNDALGRLEAEIVRRRRLADDAPDEVTGLAELRHAHLDQPLPLLVLITAVPDGAGRRRLETVLGLGSPLGISAVLLGQWPSGGTVTLTDDGHVTTATGAGLDALTGARACTLTTGDAADLLATVAHARTDDPTPEPPPLERPAQAPPPPAQLRVELRVLGPIRLLAAGQAVSIGQRRSARELAVYLAAHPEGASPDAITEAIWPDLDPPKTVQRRKDAFKTLRQALRDAADIADDLIPRTGDGHYRLHPDVINVDLWRFHAALADAAHAGDDTARATALTRAADAYTGDLAADATYEWIEPVRENERRHAVDALTRLAEIQSAENPESGLAYLEKAFTLDPYSEEVGRGIMEIQYGLGRLDAVRRTFQVLETRLAEIGLEPDEESANLYRQGRHAPGT